MGVLTDVEVFKIPLWHCIFLNYEILHTHEAFVTQTKDNMDTISSSTQMTQVGHWPSRSVLTAVPLPSPAFSPPLTQPKGTAICKSVFHIPLVFIFVTLNYTDLLRLVLDLI